MARWDRQPGTRVRRRGERRGLASPGSESRPRWVWPGAAVRGVARPERMRLSVATLGARTSVVPGSGAANCWSRVAAEFHVSR